MAYPEGKGCFVWDLTRCAGGSPIALASKAQEAGFSWLAFKVQNGADAFQAELVPAAIAACVSAGIEAWGWGYLYGRRYMQNIAQAEARRTVERCKALPLAGFIMDAESEYKTDGGADRARTYCTAVRSAMPNLTLGLCSYRFPTLHPQLPWSTFLSVSAFHMPQVYWEQAHNPGFQLNRSVKELSALRKLPIIPVGSAYANGGWAPTVGDLNEFNATAKLRQLPGVSWWSFQHAEKRPDWWAAISAHQWDADTIPPQPLTDAQKLERLWAAHPELHEA